MTTATYTPGRWYWDKVSTGHVVVDSEGFTIVDPSPMGEADARLIAAAPMMLDALLDALPYVEDVLADPVALACFKPGTVQRHAAAIRAAIARATGAA